MVREKVERIVNAMPDASGGRDRQRREIREKRRKKGVQGIPIIGDENMIQEMPEEFNKVLEVQRSWQK